jgi:hypothetical protein
MRASGEVLAPTTLHSVLFNTRERTSVVVKALCYKLEGRGFENRRRE